MYDDELRPAEHLYQVQGIPEDAQLMGLDRNTEEGALVNLAGSLDGAKPSHKLVAWAILLSFVAPLVFALLAQVF